MLTLKYTFDKRKLKEKFHEILVAGLTEGSDDQHTALLVYSLGRVDYTEEQIEEFVKELPLTIKDKVMSTYDLLIEKGIEKGRQEERAKAQRLIEQERARAELERTRAEEQERAKAYAEKLESAKEFKKMGLPVADIAKGLQLSIEAVEKL